MRRSLGFLLCGLFAVRSYGSQCSTPPTCVQSASFPKPTVQINVKPKTAEQIWMDTHWPGYMNGVSTGGTFVIEDWMFWRGDNVEENEQTLFLKNGASFSNHAWSQVLLANSSSVAFETVGCHLSKYISDDAISQLAEAGINTIRLPVGYWYFDDPSLFPEDVWPLAPNEDGWGVNPEYFVTSGTQPLTDFILRLYNQNMKVILDHHAVPGCSSPDQSYAGIKCEAKAPNTWNGLARDGISGGFNTTRSQNSTKTWMDVAKTILLQRMVPYVRYINSLAPGAIIGLEPINEPDVDSSDATTEEVRCLTVGFADPLLQCLGDQNTTVRVVISNDAQNYRPAQIAQDLLSSDYIHLNNYVYVDIHHYFNWGGCDPNNEIQMDCVCHSGLPAQTNDDDYFPEPAHELLQHNFSLLIGEWSSALGPAHSCNGGLPTPEIARSMYLAQKWNALSLRNYSSYFVGDFYWTTRMGYNWSPAPGVCQGPTSSTDYKNFPFWDWSYIRLLEIDLVKPVSSLGLHNTSLTPATLPNNEQYACTGSFPVNCK